MAAKQETLALRPYVAARVPAETPVVRGPAGLARLGRPAAQAGLLAVMVIGCLSLVTAIPAAWLWLASQLADSYVHVSGALYLMVGIGIPVSMAIGGKLLAHVGALYERVRATRPRSVPDAWRRSLRDGRSSSAPVCAIDVISTATAAAAVLALAVYLGLDLTGAIG